jgi:hypothetical protein
MSAGNRGQAATDACITAQGSPFERCCQDLHPHNAEHTINCTNLYNAIYCPFALSSKDGATVPMLTPKPVPHEQEPTACCDSLSQLSVCCCTTIAAVLMGWDHRRDCHLARNHWHQTSMKLGVWVPLALQRHTLRLRYESPGAHTFVAMLGLLLGLLIVPVTCS